MVRVKKLGNCMDYPTVAKPAKVRNKGFCILVNRKKFA